MGAFFRPAPNTPPAQYLRAIANLVDNPRIGQPMTDDGLRRYVIPRIPFSIVYRVTEDHIEIVHIWDQRSDPAKLGLQEEAAAYT
ncbi:type II toxin-antitoxin system RelE/ParE family toxin [Kumtagia ephedrae]|uniref:Type II toxin-antitoxin system RelE/ParE family toxin n=1 Tax=Kumtagia ephedrae TaxID=2116701 RepID=A0A2P7S6I3_9HYPH|nr:type II toxin-antitoxin system RelE/ParE family toxin [Mesorhizobium ephedrae]PSJ58084.1 hypothetical protein C7I84_16610 [Mesorhizobium ephedrae]